MPGKRINDLDDRSVFGIWEASRAGGLAGGNPLEDVTIRSAGLLAEKGYWRWTFTSVSEETSSWQDLHGNFWVVDPEDGDVRAWGS